MGMTEVETIGIKLTLDAGGLMGNAEAATASMNAFTAAAERAGSGASQMKSLGGAQVAGRSSGSGPSSAQMAAVPVPLTVTAASLATLRAEIIKGLGSIPINITPTVAKSIAAEAKGVVAAISTPTIGTRSGAATAVETAVRQNLPTRAHGGPVNQGQPVLVGEKRPEIYTPRQAGTIHPDAGRYYREQARLRRHEAELAALEYQRERQHEREMGRIRGGSVRGYGGKYGSARPGSVGSFYDSTRSRYEGDPYGFMPSRLRAPFAPLRQGDQVYHVTDRIEEIRGRYHGHGVGVATDRRGESAWGTIPLPHFGSQILRTSVPENFEGTSLGVVIKGRVPLSALQYWGDDSNWHRFRKGRARQDGGHAMSGRRVARLAPPTVYPHTQTFAEERRAATYKMVHGHGNIKGWQNEMWRQQEAAENADEARWAEDWAEALREYDKTPHRSYGGGSKKGALPRGYKVHFYSPDDGDSLVEFAHLKVPDRSRYSRVNQPVFGRGPNEPSMAGIIAVVKHGQQVAATFPFSFDSRPEQHGIPTPHGSFHPEYSMTRDTERRKGLASSAYVRLEKFTGRPIAPSHSQLPRGVAFWAQPDRQFGKIFGPRSMTAGQAERAAEATELTQEAIAARSALPGQNRATNAASAAARRRWNALIARRAIVDQRARVAAAEAARPPVFGEPRMRPARYRPDPYQRYMASRTSSQAEYQWPDPWAVTRVPQPRPVFGKGFDPIEGHPTLSLPITFAPSHDPMRRMLGGPAHAGAGSIAYRATMANEGGTFPLSGGPQPPKGYAVGIDTGTSHLVEDASNYRDFLKQFHEQRKSQMEAGNFPPFVGTWLSKGKIHIDPAAVLGRRREADLVARSRAQEAFFHLLKTPEHPYGEEIPTSTKRLRASVERINQIIMSGRKRMAGGAVENAFERSGKEAELLHRYNPNLVQPHTKITPEISERIDRIRAAAREHWIGLDERVEGNPIYIGQAIGGKSSVAPFNTKPAAGLPPEIMRRWRTGSNHRYGLSEMGGLTGIHNHPPGYKGVTDVWRASIPDIRTMFGSREKESWVVTPSYTQIMRNSPGYGRGPDQRSLGTVMAHGLADALGEDPSQFVKTGMQGFTPKFIRAFSSPEVLGSFALQKSMFDRAAEEYGFNWELYRHPAVGRWQRPPRGGLPSTDQMGFGLATGGPVHALTGLQQAKAAARSEIYDRVIAGFRATASRVTPELLRSGAQDWYTIAHAQALGDMADFGKLDLGNVGIGAFAAASPGQSWDSNRAIARHIMRTGDFPRAELTEDVPGHSLVKASATYGYKNWEKFRDIIAHRSLLDPSGKSFLSGTKVVPFYGNLTGLDPRSPTLDARMGRMTEIEGWNQAFGDRWQRSMQVKALEELFPEYQKAWGLNNISEFQSVLWSAYGRGTDLGSDWARTKSGISIPRHPGISVPYHRAVGGPALASDASHGLVHPSPGFFSGVLQTASDWASDPFMAIMAWQQQQSNIAGRASGGDATKGMYIVNEIADEAFITDADVPKLAAARPDILASIPKARMGAKTGMIGLPANSLFSPEKDGMIIPAHNAKAALEAVNLMARVPHRQEGGETLEAAFQRSKVDPYRNIRHQASVEWELKLAHQAAGIRNIQNMFATPRKPPPGPSYTPSTATLGSLGLVAPGRGMSTGPILTPAAEAAAKMAAAFTRAAVAADKIRVAYEGFAPVFGSKKAASRGVATGGVATGGGATSASDEDLLNGPALFENPEWRAARDRVLARRDALRSPIERVSTSYKPQDQTRSPSLLPGENLEDFAARQGGQVFMADNGRSLTGAHRAPRGMLGAGRTGPAGRGSPSPESDILAQDWQVRLARQSEGASDFGQFESGRNPKNLFASISSMLTGRGSMIKLQHQRQTQQMALNLAVGNIKNREVDGTMLSGKAQMEQYSLKRDELNSLKEITPAQKQRAAGLRDELKVLRDSSPQMYAAVGKGEELNTTLKKLAPTAGGVARNLATVLGATTLYGVAMQGMSVVMDAAGTASGRLFDQFSGFVPTMTKVTTGLADQTLAQGGNYKAALASQGATAGLSSEFGSWVESALKATTMAKTGAKAYTQLSELYRASIGSGGAPQGLYGGYGGILGSPVLAEQMGGGKGLMEQVLADINASRGQSGFDGGKYLGLAAAGAVAGGTAAAWSAIPTGPIGPGLGAAIGAVSAGGYALIDDIANDRVLGGSPAPAVAGDAEKELGKQLQSAMGRAQDRDGGQAYKFAYRADAYDKLKDLAGIPEVIKQIAKAGYAMVDGNDEVVTGFNDLNAAAGKLATGLSIVDPAEWFKTAERQLGAQFERMDIQSLVNRTLVIPLQFAVQRLQEPYQAPGAGLLPNAVVIQRISNLPMGLGKGLAAGMATQFLSSPTSQGGRGMSPEMASSIVGSLARANQMQQDNLVANKAAIEAAATMIEKQPGGQTSMSHGQALGGGFTSSPGSGGWSAGTGIGNADQYRTLMTSASDASQKLQGLNAEIASLNAEASRAAWANTTRLAIRGIKDAVGMLAGGTGKKGGSPLGQIEGQLWKIGRASQALSLQLQQREITTALAQAQFQAPGQTGEERYFAQKEAIVKAGIQQQQLGFSQETFDLVGQQWLIQAQRNIEDSKAAFDAARKVQAANDLAAGYASEIAGLSLQIQKDLSAASDIETTALGKFSTMQDELTKFVGTFGGDLTKAGERLGGFGGLVGESATGLTSLLKSMGYVFKSNTKTGGQDLIRPDGGGTTSLNGTGNRDENGVFQGPIVSPPSIPNENQTQTFFGPGGPGNGLAQLYDSIFGSTYANGNASGFLGTTSGMSQMTVGEAGAETVAVLRNPRASSMAGWGGSAGSPTNLTININGPVVRGDQDISDLARQVAIEVERSLARKGQMFGLRGPAV